MTEHQGPLGSISSTAPPLSDQSLGMCLLRPHRPHPSRVPPAGGSALGLASVATVCLSVCYSLGTRSRSPATPRRRGECSISYPSWVRVTLPGCSWDVCIPISRIPLHGRLALPEVGGGEVGPRRQNQGRREQPGRWRGGPGGTHPHPTSLSGKRTDGRVGDHRVTLGPVMKSRPGGGGGPA